MENKYPVDPEEENQNGENNEEQEKIPSYPFKSSKPQRRLPEANTEDYLHSAISDTLKQSKISGEEGKEFQEGLDLILADKKDPKSREDFLSLSLKGADKWAKKEQEGKTKIPEEPLGKDHQEEKEQNLVQAIRNLMAVFEDRPAQLKEINRLLNHIETMRQAPSQMRLKYLNNLYDRLVQAADPKERKRLASEALTEYLEKPHDEYKVVFEVLKYLERKDFTKEELLEICKEYIGTEAHQYPALAILNDPHFNEEDLIALIKKFESPRDFENDPAGFLKVEASSEVQRLLREEEEEDSKSFDQKREDLGAKEIIAAREKKRLEPDREKEKAEINRFVGLNLVEKGLVEREYTKFEDFLNYLNTKPEQENALFVLFNCFDEQRIKMEKDRILKHTDSYPVFAIIQDLESMKYFPNLARSREFTFFRDGPYKEIYASSIVEKALLSNQTMEYKSRVNEVLGEG